MIRGKYGGIFFSKKQDKLIIFVFMQKVSKNNSVPELNIYYSGRIRDTALLPELTEEVKDIADCYEWDYLLFNEGAPEPIQSEHNYDNHVYGICLMPPGCPAIDLCFQSNGNLIPHQHEYLYGHRKTKLDGCDVFFTFKINMFTAGVDMHRLIIHLIKYLRKKYLTEFTFSDETGYWHTRSVKGLKEKFKHLQETK